MPEAAESFLADMISDVQEGFQPDTTTSFEATALHGLKDITASSGRVVCTLPVKQRVQNRYNTLHGGCTGQHNAESLLIAFWVLTDGFYFARVAGSVTLPPQASSADVKASK